MFCNDDGWIDNVHHLSPIGKSDHGLLYISIGVSRKTDCIKNDHHIDYYTGNYEACRQELECIDWEDLEVMDVNDAWLLFKDQLKCIESKYVPLKQNRKSHKQSWMTKKVKQFINKKHKLLKKYTNNRSLANYNNYVSVRNKVKLAITETIKTFEYKLARECKTNAKCFWKYVNSKLKRKTGVGALIKDDGQQQYQTKKRQRC